MMKLEHRGMPGSILIAMLAILVAARCSAAPAPEPSPAPPPVVLAPGAGIVRAGSAGAIAAADRAALRFTPADVEFMAGMIPHHAQAIIMGGWAASHGARSDVRALAERIIVSQRDEIRLMSRWLAERGQAVPDSTATRHRMKMGGMVHEMLMPGMLSDEQMAALDKARGSAFDRLFLIGMIGHHQGAIEMVQTLFASPGGGQEETVFRFASDVLADQAAEINRMQVMLETVPPQAP
jgi:uncharacterized protein (DUF305 family)